MSGNFRAKMFDITQVRTRRLIARVEKESRFASSTSFLMCAARLGCAHGVV